jgi:hypothetical protein
VLLSIGRNHADTRGTLIINPGMDKSKADLDPFLLSLQNGVKTLHGISSL